MRLKLPAHPPTRPAAQSQTRMQYLVPSSHAWSIDALPDDERRRVSEVAASLAEAARAGQALQPLRGKNVAVLCEHAACPGFDIFSRAAMALGARVTHIRPSEALNSEVHLPETVGGLLGRLYDAIDCHGLAPDLLERLARTTGRPVFNALGCQGDGSSDRPADEYTLQALLLSALA